MQIETVKVTPILAKKWLESNVNNRRIREENQKINKKRGGKRKGAGRPVTKEPTVVKRIPLSKLDAVLKAIGKA